MLVTTLISLPLAPPSVTWMQWAISIVLFFFTWFYLYWSNYSSVLKLQRLNFPHITYQLCGDWEALLSAVLPQGPSGRKIQLQMHKGWNREGSTVDHTLLSWYFTSGLISLTKAHHLATSKSSLYIYGQFQWLPLKCIPLKKSISCKIELSA